MEYLLQSAGVIEVYKYYPWYEIYKFHEQGIECTSSNVIWKPIYFKYFPKNKITEGKDTKYIKLFVNDLVKRLDCFQTMLQNPINDVSKREKLEILICRFVRFDDRSLVEFIIDKLDAKYLWVVKFINFKLRTNSNFMTMVIKKNSSYIEYAGRDVWNNIDFVKIAVRKNWQCAKRYIGAFIHNEEVIREAIEENCDALEYAGPNLLNDDNLMRKLIGRDYRTLKYASLSLLNDEDLLNQTVKQSFGESLKYIVGDIRSKVVEKAIKDHWMNLKYCTEEERNNPYIVKDAVYQDWEAIKYSGHIPKKNKEIVNIVIKRYISAYLKNNNLIYTEEVANLAKQELYTKGIL